MSQPIGIVSDLHVGQGPVPFPKEIRIMRGIYWDEELDAPVLVEEVFPFEVSEENQ